VGLLDWVYITFCAEVKGWDGPEVTLEERCEVENKVFADVLLFLIVGTGGGLIFMHLVAVIGLEKPTGYWCGLYVMAPLATLTMYVSMIYFVRSHGVGVGNCRERLLELCTEVFCCGTAARISAQPEEENPTRPHEMPATAGLWQPAGPQWYPQPVTQQWDPQPATQQWDPQPVTQQWYPQSVAPQWDPGWATDCQFVNNPY
jgi:hypothetical protein